MWQASLERQEAAWKEKNLDYEIETTTTWPASNEVTYPWKEKNLDYEIET